MEQEYTNDKKTYGYPCQACIGNGLNESYLKKLCDSDSRFKDFQIHVACEICGGLGWLTGKEFKAAFGESPEKLGVRASLVIE
jgi:hypothetical protein